MWIFHYEKLVHKSANSFGVCSVKIDLRSVAFCKNLPIRQGMFDVVLQSAGEFAPARKARVFSPLCVV